MITLSNAATDPWTVMIMDRDANVTGVAMEYSSGFDNHTCWAFLANYVFFTVLLSFTSFAHLHSAFWILRIRI